MSNINLGSVYAVVDEQLNILVGERARPSYGNGLLRLLTTESWRNAGLVKLGNVQMVGKGDGKRYKVARTFNPKTRSNDILDNEPMEYCPTDGLKVTPLYDEVTLRYYHKSNKIEVDDALLRCIQQGKTDYRDFSIQNELINYLNALDKKIATIVARDLVGTFKRCDCDVPADTCRDLPLFLSTGFQINPAGEAILRRDMKENQAGMEMVLVGSGLLMNYGEARKIQAPSDLGFDASLLDIQGNVFEDTNIGYALGDSRKFLAISPGAIQLVTYNRHQGDFTHQTQYQTRGTTPDPFYGLTHDVLVSIEDCGDEVKYFIQFAIGFDVIGMPECWTDDCQFSGMRDVFCYTGVCADTSFCDIDDPCGEALNTGDPNDMFCTATEECTVTCNADFETECSTFTRFGVVGQNQTLVNAFRVNGGVDKPLSRSYDLTDSTDSAAFVAELKTKLGVVSGVILVSGYFSLGQTYLNIYTLDNIISIALIDQLAGDVNLQNVIDELIHVVDISTPSTGKTITNLSWSFGVGPVTFNGAPGASIGNQITAFGDYDNFFTSVTNGGSFMLTMTDSGGCSETHFEDSAECPVTFNSSFVAFEDTNDNDIQDVGEPELQNVYLQVYADEALTQLIDTQVTDVDGEVTFNLPTGEYWLTVDLTQGAAVGRTLATTLPKFFYITLGGTTMYGAQFSENGLVPISPLA